MTEEQNTVEKMIFHGTPSQIINIKTYFLCIAMLALSCAAPTIWNYHIIIYYPQYAHYKDMYKLASKILFILPFIWTFIAWARVHNHKYTITTERLREETGILSKHTEELELFRIKDISYSRPFWLRMFGCGNIIMNTSDRSTPVMVLEAIKNAASVSDELRKNILIMRQKKGVREIDY